ncbi:MAG: hypothetical protein ACJ76D_04465 [Solirubrobacterales bacterium]
MEPSKRLCLSTSAKIGTAIDGVAMRPLFQADWRIDTLSVLLAQFKVTVNGRTRDGDPRRRRHRQSSSVQTLVRDLVNGPRMGTGWVMANSEGRVDEHRPPLPLLDAEYHAEFAIRERKTQLQAMPEGGSIRSLLIAGQEAANRHPLPFELPAGRMRRRSAWIAGTA